MLRIAVVLLLIVAGCAPQKSREELYLEATKILQFEEAELAKIKSQQEADFKSNAKAIGDLQYYYSKMPSDDLLKQIEDFKAISAKSMETWELYLDMQIKRVSDARNRVEDLR